MASRPPVMRLGRVGRRPTAGPRGGRRQDTRPSASRRGYDVNWRRLRKAFLQQHPLCRRCEARGQVQPAEQVHHTIPISQDPSQRLDWGNLEPLCSACHTAHHAKDPQ
jgi:5-methylcytosine-specific restriction protein A